VKSGCQFFWLGSTTMPHLHPPPQHEHVSMHRWLTVKCVSVLLGGGAWSGCNTSRAHPAPGGRYHSYINEKRLCRHRTAHFPSGRVCAGKIGQSVAG
jgi:hypothetical protein